MLIKKDFEKSSLCKNTCIPDKTLMIDIETSGLSIRNSQITVIGTGYMYGEYFRFVQFFLDDLAREKEMLIEFSGFMKDFDYALHFNGTSFDIPFIRQKCTKYELSDPFSHTENIDLFRIAGKYRSLLKLTSLKQKSIEKRCGLPRTDTISGAECITAYQEYIRSDNIKERDLLLLHNEDDVLGLCRLHSFYGYELLNDHNNIVPCSSSLIKEEGSDYHLMDFDLKAPLPLPISSSGRNYNLEITDKKGRLVIKGSHRRLNYYFPDYKDYYYLPDEDTAIHKSVAIYVDRSKRKKAARENCCEKHEGVFFPQPLTVIDPSFKETWKSRLSWYALKDARDVSGDDISRLAQSYIKYSLKAAKGNRLPFEL